MLPSVATKQLTAESALLCHRRSAINGGWVRDHGTETQFFTKGLEDVMKRTKYRPF